MPFEALQHAKRGNPPHVETFRQGLSEPGPAQPSARALATPHIGGPTVVRVRAWMDAAGIADGPLFQRLDKAGKPRGRLSTQSIRAIIQRRAQDAGIEGRVSGHSLRVGSAQSLATAGASVVELQTAGRWQSPSMPGHYARGQLVARGAVARVRYGRG